MAFVNNSGVTVIQPKDNDNTIWAEVDIQDTNLIHNLSAVSVIHLLLPTTSTPTDSEVGIPLESLDFISGLDETKQRLFIKRPQLNDIVTLKHSRDI